MAEQDKIDRLLDRALGEYGENSPQAGLEGRVLARLKAETDRPRNLRWWWIAVPAMAVLVVVALVMAMHPEAKKIDIASVPPVRIGVQSAPPMIAVAPRRDVVTGPSNPMRPKKLVRTNPTNPKARDSEPRLATFPAEDGDDELVKLAMQFANAHPEKAREIVQEQKDFREMAEAFTAPLKDEK
jgi:hypothetical protein